MRCHRLQRFLLGFLEGELTPPRQQQVATHVLVCPACAAALRGLEQTLTLVRRLPVHEPDEAYWRSLLPALQQRVREEEHIAPRRRVLRDWLWQALPRPALAALATSLLLVAVLPMIRGLWQPHTTPVLVLSEQVEANALSEIDFLRNLDLLEEVDVVADSETTF